MTNLDIVLKCRDITLLERCPQSQTPVAHPVVIYKCEIKRAESGRIDVFIRDAGEGT